MCCAVAAAVAICVNVRDWFQLLTGCADLLFAVPLSPRMSTPPIDGSIAQRIRHNFRSSCPTMAANGNDFRPPLLSMLLCWMLPLAFFDMIPGCHLPRISESSSYCVVENNDFCSCCAIGIFHIVMDGGFRNEKAGVLCVSCASMLVCMVVLVAVADLFSRRTFQIVGVLEEFLNQVTFYLSHLKLTIFCIPSN